MSVEYKVMNSMNSLSNTMQKQKLKLISQLFHLALLSILLCGVNIETKAGGIGTKVPISSALEVSVGQSSVIRLKEKPERIALSNPGIAYVLMITPDQMEVIGRNPGRTNLYVWFPPGDDSKPGTPSQVLGTEISVGLPKPPYITQTPTMEILNGEFSELIYLGNPSERIRNSIPARTSGPATDMPEPCLSPGCI